MVHHDELSAEVLVFTFKEGLLSKLAHDLKLKVGRFSIDIDGAAVAATFDPRSLEMVTPRKDGVDEAGLLPAALYGEIEKNARDDVLEVSRYPTIRFAAVAGEAEVKGQLTLHGATREICCKRADTPTHHVAEVWLDVRDFGIKPYKAMLGALKVEPKVQVVVRLPRK